MLALIRDLDDLLATRKEFLLGNWLEDARHWGATDAERNRLEWNARRILTLWGNTPALRDYACRQWSGMLLCPSIPEDRKTGRKTGLAKPRRPV